MSDANDEKTDYLKKDIFESSGIFAAILFLLIGANFPKTIIRSKKSGGLENEVSEIFLSELVVKKTETDF